MSSVYDLIFEQLRNVFNTLISIDIGGINLLVYMVALIIVSVLVFGFINVANSGRDFTIRSYKTVSKGRRNDNLSKGGSRK